jgi:DNA modification methylase
MEGVPRGETGGRRGDMNSKLRAIQRGISHSSARVGGRLGLAYGLPALRLAELLPSSSFDLIYADPPFGTGKPRRSRNGGYADPGGESHLGWLKSHLEAFHRLLSDTGVLFLHLDWRAAPYARLLLDGIFGAEHLVNEIVWSYKTGGVPRRHLARKHDTILFYGKTRRYTFHRAKERSHLRHRYGYSNITIRHDAQGPYRETYLRDVWEIPALRGNQKEATGYPTQKPLALLERILRIGSSAGDLIFDPFCGSGTTACAAEKLDRFWITTDTSRDALPVLRRRLRELEKAAGSNGRTKAR